MRAERTGDARLRRRLAERVRSRNLPVDVEAAEQVRRSGWSRRLSVELLLDNSAWMRLGVPILAQVRTEEIADALEDQRIATCLPFLLEAGYSARRGSDHDELIRELMTLPLLHIDEAVERRAIDAQRQLARAGHHRLPPVDLILAALADLHGIGILHYDHDFDLIAEKTDLRFVSVWLATRGTL